jgi:hypothetical protein
MTRHDCAFDRKRLAAGSVVDWIIAALEGAIVVGGARSLGAGLLSLGILKGSVVKYEASIKAGKFVLAAHGTRSLGKADGTGTDPH